jgi:hypothetical protein
MRVGNGGGVNSRSLCLAFAEARASKLEHRARLAQASAEQAPDEESTAHHLMMAELLLREAARVRMGALGVWEEVAQ